MPEITVAVVQMQPVLGQMEENLVKMGEFIRRIATEQPVDLIIFPELATTGYEVGPRFPQMAQRVPGPAVNIIAQRAAEYGVHVAFGLVTKEKVESILYNSAVLVGPDGEVIGQYQKVHLRGEERMAFRAGYPSGCPSRPTSAWSGLLIGWDLAFPEAARSLVLEGAEVLAVLANWEEPRTSEEWRTYLTARAYENAVYVAAANRVGEEPSYTFFGQSSILGPTRTRCYASGGRAGRGVRGGEGWTWTRCGDSGRRSQVLQCRQPHGVSGHRPQVLKKTTKDTKGTKVF
jgi:predicted amidohydrolase